MVDHSLRIEERFIPGEYLIKAYPELWFNRRKGYAGFLTNMRLFFGDGRRLYDLSLGSVESLKWARERRLSLFWITVVLAVEFLILFGAPPLGLPLMVVTLLLVWLWREEALVMTVGHRRHLIFAQTRVLNDIARNIRLHQAVLRSGEAGAVLGQRILEAMPMGPKVPPPEGGNLAEDYARHVGDHDPVKKDEGWLPPRAEKEEEEEEPAPAEGLEALRKLESQTDLTGRARLMQLAYRLWAGRAKWTRIFWALGLMSLYLALLIYVLADLAAYFDDEVASPWIRAAQIQVLVGLLFFLWFFVRMADNRHRGVEPQREEIIIKLGYRDIPLRVACNFSGYFILFNSLAFTYIAYNLQFFLYGLVISSLILAFGRTANLVRMPQWLHLTRPWPKWRTFKLGFNGARVVSVIWLFILLAPYFAYHDAVLPGRHLNAVTHNGWKLDREEGFNRGLGAVQVNVRVYMDQGAAGGQEGYPALLILVSVKEPRDFLLERVLTIVDVFMAIYLIAYEVEQLERLANQTRTTVQGYQTHFVIYNATAKGSTFFTKGEEVRLIGEDWWAEKQRVMVVAIGMAQISTETLDREPDPPEELPEPVRQAWKVIWEQLPDEVKESDPPIDPTNTTDTRNWLELYDLIPRVVAR